MSEPSWSRVGDPFDEPQLEWTVVEVADAGDEVRVVPRVRVEALHLRFDDLLGVAGWSVSYAALPGDAVACHLVIDGVTKGAVAAPALVGGGAATAAVAFNLAAARFGVRPPWPDGAGAWVACDPETLEPLHPPEWPDALPERDGPPLVRPLAPGIEARAYAAPVPARASTAETRGAPAPTGASSTEPSPTEPSPTGPSPTAAADATAEVAPPAPKPEGQQIIDRLIERLKAEGQGLASARILVKHGGYGKDPKAARELYAELRDLLRATSERDGETAGAG